MTARQATAISAFALAALLSLAGCRARPHPTAAASEPQPPEIQGFSMRQSAITVVDPKGAWKFEAHAEHIEASSIDGPFTLTPARCTYRAAGRPPVTLESDRATVDQKAMTVTLEGDVTIVSGDLKLQAGRVAYDLKTGEVVAEGDRN